jgi:hypothetical protein
MGRWKRALLKIVNVARRHPKPPRETVELIRDWSAQGMGPRQIAVNLNMLNVDKAPEGVWTSDSVKMVLRSI